MAFDPAILGFPVELNQVSRQLKKLWESGGDHMTRASLINFAVFAQGADTLTDNTALISKFVRNHSCRAVLVAHEPAATDHKVTAWIQAHCHLTKAGAKQTCSEQISLLAEGFSQDGVANVLLSNLDYDLPLNLWWQPELPPSAKSALWSAVDRLIIDSASWTNPGEQLHRLHQLKAKAGSHMGISDLNWARSLCLRRAIAQCFDHPAVLADAQKVRRIEVHNRSGFESTAWLLICWFGAQFGWSVINPSKHASRFRTASGEIVECSLHSSDSGAILSGIEIHSEAFSLNIRKDPKAPLLSSQLDLGDTRIEGLFSADSEDLIDLLGEEMNPSLKHKVYLKTLALLQTVF